MIKIVNLQNTLNPITATERVKINQNWDELRRAFSQIQLQINFLAGGTEVNEIIERIENAVRMAEAGSQEAIGRVNEALSDLNVALNNLEALTTETNVAKDNAISATNDARNAIQEISDFMNEFRSLGPWNSNTQYKRNNMVSLNGNTYIAKVDNVGSPVTEGSVWTLFARRGFDGDRGPQGEAGASLNVRGSLPNESSLPSIGVPGDAYTINGDLYVWSTETNGWVNVGQIKGEKGDRGEKGDSGYYTLANFQYTVPATSEGQTVIQIPLESFNDQDHSILLFINSVALRNDQYSISGRTITLNEAVVDYQNTTFYLNITQGVLVQPLDTINGSSIANGSISNAKLNNALANQINGYENRITTLENQTNTSTANVAGLNREVAYLKLKQEASDRIEGGTVFADDFMGSRFGFTLNENESSSYVIQNGKVLLKDYMNSNINLQNLEVSTSNYTLNKSGGKRIVRLSNGWILSVTFYPSNGFAIHRILGDNTARLLGTVATSLPTTYWAIASKGKNLMIATLGFTTGTLASTYFDVTELNGGPVAIGEIPSLKSAIIASDQTTISSLALNYDPTNDKFNVAWSSRIPSMPNTYNVKYASSLDSGVSWTNTIRVTENSASNADSNEVSITSFNGNALVTYVYKTATNSYSASSYLMVEGDEAIQRTLVPASSYVKRSTATTVDKNNIIHVCLSGTYAGNSSESSIFYTKSLDGQTWITNKQIALGDNPSISTDVDGNVYISYTRSGSCYYIKSTDGGDNFGSPVLIGVGTFVNSLDDKTLKVTRPPSIRFDSTRIVFDGAYVSEELSDALNATLVYDIPSTDYIGAFVKKSGSVNVQAYINNSVVGSTLSNGEYEIESSLENEAPVKLRLELSRTSTSGEENDYIDRILGGRS